MRLGDRFKGKSDDDVRAEIEARRLERRQLERHSGVFRDVVHGRVDELAGLSAQRLEGLAAGHIPVGPLDPAAAELAMVYVLALPAFGERLKELIDDATDYADGTLAEHQAKVAKFGEEIRLREAELERRAADRRRAEAEAEAAAIEASVR